MYLVEVLKCIKWKVVNAVNRRYMHYDAGQFEKALKKWYKKNHDKDLDFTEPKTFNEKIQWLKLYDSTPEKAMLADKLNCRNWVAERIGEEFLIPIIGGGM